MKRFLLVIFVGAIAWLARPIPSLALINVGLQPADLFERNALAFVGKVEAVDAQADSFTLRIERAVKGEMPQQAKITVRAGEAMKGRLTSDQYDYELMPDAPFVAFIGGARGQRNQVLLYRDGWFIATVQADGSWLWSADDKQAIGVDDAAVPTMAGTWNGSTTMFARLLDDLAAKHAFLPRKAYLRFRSDVLMDHIEGGKILGVALRDIDGDGDLDMYVCSDIGDRLYLQVESMLFVQATDWVGLDVASPSVAFADVDGDGLDDVLAGGEILAVRKREGQLQLEPMEWLPPEANEEVKTAMFVELNGDGWPDVLISRADGGLRAWLHPGDARLEKTPLVYREVTKAMGLDTPQAGADQTGFVAVGDWNDDGRADLFFAVGKGLLLKQNEQGRFEPVPHDADLRFTSGEDDAPGLTGAAAFADVMGNGRMDLMIPTQDGWCVLANEGDKAVDVTRHGNEISEGSYLHLATIAEDLSLDGIVDFYTVSRAEKGQNRLMLNRGYGTFMLADTHKVDTHMFDGPAHTSGGWGVVAGDFDDDGAPDLLLGNDQGQVFLLLNDTLRLRADDKSVTADQTALRQSSVLKVRLTSARAAVGASLRLIDAQGRTVVRRDLNANAIGSTGPREAILVALHPGKHTLQVRFGDGRQQRLEVYLRPGGRSTLDVAHTPAPK